MSLLEISSVLFSLMFLVLLIRQNIWCWLFGIVSSILSAILFYSIHLYSECLLYSFYAVFGFYGWMVWAKSSNESEQKNISPIQPKRILLFIAIGIPLSMLVGYLSKSFLKDAAIPYVDATTSVFGLIATYLEAHRYLSAWVFWIILNLATAVIYFDRGLMVYGPLMLVYFVFSLVGYRRWSKLTAEYER